jgi:isoleucyl-tRNA synthetase
VATEGGVTVALELDLTPELRREGVARELVRLVQDARKAAGLEIADRIELSVESSGDVAAALDAHRDEIAGETLATIVDHPVDDGFRQEEELDGTRVVVTLRNAG